ncbi:DNA cytosine methyltransferase [Plectonema cf. radiosum LEGE 06105]|uniref:Cytosine-specific methyltransferase n=1 Tax=Plectonema cf. radiosum LEGE 06105 TaxID=945769 RepID=A0A8J7F9F2_9CYAN|nr:DNA cytosine methyltransferase [Plectonema radiosum]MBE9216785.1 DNA cytosine methyltransferase [Plectonema cf. radiosum LEGE 06105]
MRPIAVDLFAGAGGMTLGFEQAGFDVLAAVELDPIHCAIHEFNFPLWSILCANVEHISGEEIRRRSEIQNQEIDVVFGGSPCQGFSLMGKRALDDSRNNLIFHFFRLIIELNPKYFVFENVPGLTVGEHQKLLLEIISEFQINGYQVEGNYRVLNAANYGVPQDRARLFILGCRQGLTLPKYPQPVTTPKISKKSKYIINNPDLPATPTVWDAIGDLPEVENYSQLIDRDWIIAEYGKPSIYSRKLRGILTIENDYSYKRLFDYFFLTCSNRTKHNSQSIDRFGQTEPGKTEPISHFHKLAKNGICKTLRAGTPRNRGAFTSPRPIHPITPRCITVREAARLHSYPDWFRFHTTKWHGFRQIGNSVPPIFAKAIATEIIRILEITPVKPQRQIQLGDDSLLQLNMLQAAAKFGVSENIIEPRKRKINHKNQESKSDDN